MSPILLVIVIVIVAVVLYFLYFRQRCVEVHLPAERNEVIYSHPTPTDERALAYYNPSIIALEENKNEESKSFAQPAFLMAVRRSNYVQHSKAESAPDLFHGHHSHLYFQYLDRKLQPHGSFIYSSVDWDTSREYEDPRIIVHEGKIYVSIVHIRPNRAKRRGKSFFPLLLEYSLPVGDAKEPRLLRRIEYDRTSFGRPPYMEKNWCPFSRQSTTGSKLLLHTDSYPLWRVREVDTETGQLRTVIEHDVKDFFDAREYPNLRCSTSWVLVREKDKGEYICALHTKGNDVYRTVLVSIDARTLLPLRYSKRLCLIPHGHSHHEKIQFVSGLLVQGADLILTAGIADLSFDIVRIKDYHDLLTEPK